MQDPLPDPITHYEYPVGQTRDRAITAKVIGFATVDGDHIRSADNPNNDDDIFFIVATRIGTRDPAGRYSYTYITKDCEEFWAVVNGQIDNEKINCIWPEEVAAIKKAVTL